MITIHIAEKITITGLTKEESDKVKNSLTLSNPMYFKLMNMKGKGRAMYGVPQIFTFYKEKNGVLTIPRGKRKQLNQFIIKLKKAFTLTEDFISIPL